MTHLSRRFTTAQLAVATVSAAVTVASIALAATTELVSAPNFNGASVIARPAPLTTTELSAAVRPGDTFDLSTLDISAFAGRTATVARAPYASADRTVISGSIDALDDASVPGSFVVARRGDFVVGHLRTDATGVWRITASPATNGRMIATYLLMPTEPDCEILTPPKPVAGLEAHGDHVHAPGEDCAGCPGHGDATEGIGGGDGIVSDVLVVYTTVVESQLGGPESAAAQMDVVTEETNVAFVDSNVNAEIRLRAVHRFTGPEPSLGELRSTDDGVYDEVHTIRDGYAADFVVQIDEGGGGVAFGLDSFDGGEDQNAFCQVGINNLPFLTYTHELGHNMGACHALGDGGGCGEGLLFDYSNGHRWFGNSGTQWRSVMAYSPGSRLARFSNPDVNFDGVSSGIEPGNGGVGADNAATINQSAGFVASHRAFNSGDCTGLPIDADAPDCNNNNIPDPCEILMGLVADVNGNGIPDTCDPCAGDVDGNGVVGTSDLLSVLAGWGACPSGGACPADLNGNGSVDVSDLLVLLSAWGPCP
ncbi:MAG: zinc-dependent metalloprotease family protein [Phycisphaerales bacterium]